MAIPQVGQGVATKLSASHEFIAPCRLSACTRRKSPLSSMRPAQNGSLGPPMASMEVSPGRDKSQEQGEYAVDAGVPSGVPSGKPIVASSVQATPQKNPPAGQAPTPLPISCRPTSKRPTFTVSGNRQGSRLQVGRPLRHCGMGAWEAPAAETTRKALPQTQAQHAGRALNSQPVRTLRPTPRPPASTMRSPHDSASPYFSLIGSSSFLALSRLVLSGQETSGSKRWRAPSHPPRPSQVLWGDRRAFRMFHGGGVPHGGQTLHGGLRAAWRLNVAWSLRAAGCSEY